MYRLLGKIVMDAGIATEDNLALVRRKNFKYVAVSRKASYKADFWDTQNENGKAKESRIGEYILRTNRLDLSDEEISKMHRSLTTLEASFRCMKSELGLRPDFHKQDIPTTAHIFSNQLKLAQG
jgi:transposase